MSRTSLLPPCFLLVSLGILADCMDELRPCELPECQSTPSLTAAMVGGEEEGIKMLQVHTKKFPRKACPFPQNMDFQIYGKGCPPHSCLDGNKPYTTIREAWAACGQIPECSSIMEYSDHKFYLRRATDPDMKPDGGSYLLRYECSREEMQQEEWRQKAEAARRKQEEAEEAEQRKIEAENARKEKEKEEARQREKDIEDEVPKLYDQYSDKDCGWSDDDMSCNMENQAFVNDGVRNATGVPAEKAIELCGRICESAGSGCGGFTYKYGSETCYFRKQTRCAVRESLGTHCYIKKISRHVSEQESQQERAILQEMNLTGNLATVKQFNHADLYHTTKETECGWSEEEEGCNLDNQAWVNLGAREANYISRDEAPFVCGQICADAGDKCGGFTHKIETQSCYFRVNSTCGMTTKEGATCYYKKKIPQETPAGEDQTATEPELPPVSTA